MGSRIGRENESMAVIPQQKEDVVPSVTNPGQGHGGTGSRQPPKGSRRGRGNGKTLISL
jgi:hypothetical protein